METESGEWRVESGDRSRGKWRLDCMIFYGFKGKETKKRIENIRLRVGIFSDSLFGVFS